MAKKRYVLTDEDKKIIGDMLDENDGAIRFSHKQLKLAGYDYGYGSVQKVAKERLEEENLQAKVVALQARTRTLQSRLTYTRKLYGESLRISEDLMGAIETIPAPKLSIPKLSKTSQTITPICSPIADWHIGEVIDEGEMEGFNKYNYEIAKRRVEFLAQKVMKWVKTERNGHNIDEIHIPIMGDMITGSIHDELITFAEFPITESVVRSSKLISWYISQISTLFKKVTVHALKVDNHSRFTKKKGSKRRGTNSWNHIIAELIKEQLKYHDNIELIFHESQKAEIDIAGQIILADHGDGTTAFMGLPWYGFAREDGREAVKRMREGKRFDDRMRAHWHTAAAGPFGILCGCLCGSTELDAQAGRHSDPYQVSFLVHPKYGWFNFCRWNLKHA